MRVYVVIKCVFLYNRLCSLYIFLDIINSFYIHEVNTCTKVYNNWVYILSVLSDYNICN